MPTFALVYRGPVGYAPTPETTAAWKAWFAGMGDQLVDLGKPAVAHAVVGNCDPASSARSPVRPSPAGQATNLPADDSHTARNGAPGRRQRDVGRARPAWARQPVSATTEPARCYASAARTVSKTRNPRS
jgi:hypothetical protein